ncbi:hypothetical protein SAMN06309945_1467 [Okibacterium fritillariae]|uniref:RelA/SpoT domain-containing protein n=1 Tax=Okibacterium fritillariae TaxID=123320 RepID=A0A1T5JED9_9MICO|nr:hypothetical protein SAMN06309945_1467 [Okibacterium fritillariae]
MTTPASWREAFSAQRKLGELLEAELAELLRGVPKGWYTETRIKAESSFNQKIETGLVENFDRLEDFVGGLIVVPLPSDVPRALEYVYRFFTVEYRRPQNDTDAESNAAEFRFNDIRLYGHLTADDSLPSSPLQSMVFEIQVKTFFQHAWSTATHDLVYKYPSFSWSRSRVSAQVKAILEHAEMSLAAIDELERVETFTRSGEPEATLNRFLQVVRDHWDDDLLPANKKRMTESLAMLSGALAFGPEDINRLLTRGLAELGSHPDGWSPYQCVVDYASRYEPESLRAALCTKLERPRVIHINTDVLTRLGLTPEEAVSGHL